MDMSYSLTHSADEEDIVDVDLPLDLTVSDDVIFFHTFYVEHPSFLAGRAGSQR